MLCEKGNRRLILLCGIPSEPPIAYVSAALDRHGVAYLHLDQRRWADWQLRVEVTRGHIQGVLAVQDARVALDTVTGVYTRLMDFRRLPELSRDSPGSDHERACQDVHTRLTIWQEITPARVVNRARPQASNASKPYQAQLARAHGFSVPATLVTNVPEQVIAFRAEHGRVVFKSASGVRSIVRKLENDDLRRLAMIRWCPVQFQEYVPGVDVRVHVIGERVFATEVVSDRTDYRYAESEGGSTTLTATTLDDDVAARCVTFAQALELPLAGIDLRLGHDGRVVCFEVNPSPAFSYYEAHTGQPIADAIARYLAGGSP